MNEAPCGVLRFFFAQGLFFLRSEGIRTKNQTGETQSRDYRIVEMCWDLAHRKGKAGGEPKPTESDLADV